MTGIEADRLLRLVNLNKKSVKKSEKMFCSGFADNL